MHVGEEFGLPPAIQAGEHRCEEASPLSGETYLPCNKPATRIVYQPRDERTYRMCGECAHHNIKNRGAVDKGAYTAGGGANGAPEETRPALVEPERLTAARSAVSTWCDAAGEWLEKGAIVDDEHAGAIKDLVAGATTLRKKIEATRRDTKKPFEEQAKAVDATFRPLTDALDKLVERIKPLETAYLQKKRAEAEAEQRRKREEAEEARKAAEAATAAAQARNDVMGEAEAEAALKAAEEAAAAAAAPVKVKIESASGGGGRATALRSIRRARITNLSMAFGIVRGDPAVVEAIEAALNRLVRSKDFNPSTDLPGVEVFTEERAA